MRESEDNELPDDPSWAADVSEHVVLLGATNESDGVAAERAWIKEHFPDHRRIRQRYSENQAGRHIDEITLSDPNGVESSVFFDITDWFGKS